MSKKTWIIFVAIVVIVFGGLIYLSNSNKINLSGIDTASIIAPNEDNGQIGDHVFGNRDSKVVLFEFGDFQCPGCGGIHPNMEKISEEYKDSIAIVFRNFPLTSIHPNARSAAAAAEAAGLQGKYREYSNKLFENQSDWQTLTGNERSEKFVAYAKEFQLDTAKFTTDMGSSEVNKKISFDQAVGKSMKVSATPTLMIGGTMVDAAIVQEATSGTGDKLRELLNSELKKHGIAPPTKTEE